MNGNEEKAWVDLEIMGKLEKPEPEGWKVNISDKAKEIIRQKTEEFNAGKAYPITEDTMLEYMILEFDASTPEERLALFRKRIELRREFFDSLEALPVEPNDILEAINKAYTKGWSNGWMQFQWRKKSCQHLRREE